MFTQSEKYQKWNEERESLYIQLKDIEESMSFISSIVQNPLLASEVDLADYTAQLNMLAKYFIKIQKNVSEFYAKQDEEIQKEILNERVFYRNLYTQ